VIARESWVAESIRKIFKNPYAYAAIETAVIYQ